MFLRSVLRLLTYVSNRTIKPQLVFFSTFTSLEHYFYQVLCKTRTDREPYTTGFFWFLWSHLVQVGGAQTSVKTINFIIAYFINDFFQYI